MDDNTLMVWKMLIGCIMIIGSYLINPNLVPLLLAALGGVAIPTTSLSIVAKEALKKS